MEHILTQQTGAGKSSVKKETVDKEGATTDGGRSRKYSPKNTAPWKRLLHWTGPYHYRKAPNKKAAGDTD